MKKQIIEKQKLEQIQHYNAFKNNVNMKIFDRVKRYHFKNIISLIKKKPDKKDAVLYVACGNGHEIKLLGHGVGVDIALNCIRNVVKLGFPGVVGDAENLPFKSDRFDYVFSNSMHHFANYEQAFGEIYRVCKKGGRIALGPEVHRYSLDQYIYNTFFRYWKFEKGMLRLTAGKIIKLFEKFKLQDIRYYYRGIDPIAVSPIIENMFDSLTGVLPNPLFFWANFYITGVK